MRDPGNLPDLLAHDLAGVDWPAPGQIRARARARTVRKAVAAPVAVLLVVASVWLLAGPGHGGGLTDEPVGGNGLSAGPAMSLPEGWFGPEVLAQPEDVGPGYELDNEHDRVPGEYPAWTFALDHCDAYAGLGVAAFRDYTWMRGNIVARQSGISTTGDVHTDLRRYAGRAVARRVMSDVRDTVEACAEHSYAGGEASTEKRPARVVHTYAIVDQGFTGDESLLIRHLRVDVDAHTGKPLPDGQGVEIIAVVQAKDFVEVLLTEQDDAHRMREIATKVAQRL